MQRKVGAGCSYRVLPLLLTFSLLLRCRGAVVCADTAWQFNLDGGVLACALLQHSPHHTG